MARRTFPLAKAYTLLEPGPVVLLTTAGPKRPNAMPMSWHCMLEFEPPLIGCVVSDRNHSFGLLESSRECVINIPTADIAEKVVKCGNSTGRRTDKFAKFRLSASPAKMVGAPLIDECYASLECRVVDTGMVAKYGFFVLEAVKAWVDPKVTNPRTIHHRGYGSFMVAGETMRLRSAKK